MSRYNGVADLTNPFIQLGFLIFVGIPFVLAFVVLAAIYDADTAEEIICDKTGIEPSAEASDS